MAKLWLWKVQAQNEPPSENDAQQAEHETEEVSKEGERVVGGLLREIGGLLKTEGLSPEKMEQPEANE